MGAVLRAIEAHLDQVDAPPWYESPTPVETCFIHADDPLLDRTELRAGLNDILYRKRHRTLVVRGPSGTGRTYSTQVVAHLAGDEQLFPLDVQTLNPGFMPDELARVIAYGTGCGPAVDYIPRSDGTTSATHNAELVGWLLTEIGKGDSPWWVLLDGLDKVDVRPETVDFVVHLMRAAEMLDRRLRVALLGCGDVLPSDLERTVCREVLTEIDRDHVRDFFKRLAQHTGIDAEDEHIEALLTVVFTDLPASGVERLEAISARVREVARVFVTGAAEEG
jgi:hypothetical protein